MDSRTHQLETVIRELAYDVDMGTESAADVRASLLAKLNAIRHDIPRQDALRLETLIERLTEWKR